MLTGDEVKAARALARMTQEQAAAAAGVSMRTWGNWERSADLTAGSDALVRKVLGPYLSVDETSSPSQLSSVSDAQLLAEIAARFDRGRQHGTATTTQPGASPGEPSRSDRLAAAAEGLLASVPPEAAEQARLAKRAMQDRAERTRKRQP